MEKIMTDVVQQKQSPFLLLIVLIIFLVMSLTALALFFKRDSIEQDLTQRANQALADSGLFKGNITFEGRDAFLSGSIPTNKAEDEIVNLVQNLNGVRVVDSELNVEPKKPLEEAKPALSENTQNKGLKDKFTLHRDNGKWVFSGNVHSSEIKESLLANTQEILGEDVVDLLETDTAIDQPIWTDKFLKILDKFAYVHGGAELTLEEGILTIGGEVDSEAAMRMTLLPIRENFGDVVSIRNTLRIPTFNNGLYLAQKQHPIEQIDISGIQFNADNTEIVSANGLNEIVQLLTESQEIYIELSGHYFEQKDENKNIETSLARAMLVKQYLVDKQIEKSRLRANGYGSSRPIDANDAKRNQRIEVTVIREG